MLRRRILSGFFKFGIKGPSDTKYDVNDISISYDYGKTKVIEYTELGTVIGTDVKYATINEYYTTFTEQKTYYKLGGKGPGTVNIAILNFTTYEVDQEVVIRIRVSSEYQNDFLAVCHLDATDKDHLNTMISGTGNGTVNFTVATPGSHFVKIYYYQHNDGITDGDNAGYFRLEPWKYTYKEAYGIDAYDKPDSQSIYIRSYYGWDVVNKSNLPAWVQLNMTEAKQGNKKLDITLAANHGIQRTYNLVIRERKVNTEITISISQGANPHPNDILLNINNANTTSDANSVTNIDIKLLGLNSYSVTNPNTTEFTYIKTDPTEIEDSEYSNMSIKESKLTITKKNTTNVNPVTFTINGLNVNGTKVMQKNIVINSDKVSCYCDCNQYNRCQCDIETRNYKQEFSGCASHSYNCSVHNANASNCDSHCAANENYTECSGHNTCECNSQCANQCNCYSKLIQTGSYCYPDTLNSCGSQCGSNGCNYSLNSCGSQCGSNGCNSNTLDTCSGHSYYCTSNTYDTCSGKCESNGCNSNSTSCSAQYLEDFYIDLILTDQSTAPDKWVAPYIEFKFYGSKYNSAITTYMWFVYEYLVNETASPKRMYLPNCVIGSTLSDMTVWGIPSNNTQTKYKMSSVNYTQKYSSPDNNKIWNGTTLSVGLRAIGSWQGESPSGCECNNEVGVCNCHTNYVCGSQSYYCSPDALNSCGSQCGSNGCNYSLNSCGSKSTYCTSNTYDTCSGHSYYCTSNTYDTCSGKCPSNGCYYSACNDGCSDGCPGKRSDCTCYTKLYYPYCECVGFCECYNYTFPEICQSHNCKTDENTCNCNSQVTCSTKSLY